jgi:hypothetical protein
MISEIRDDWDMDIKNMEEMVASESPSPCGLCYGD